MNKQQAREQFDKLMIESEKLKEIINSPDKTKEERFFELNEINEAKDHLPLILILWIPMTLVAVSTLWYHIRWQYFGITEGINPFYTNKFDASWDSYIWIIGQIGWVGMGLFCLLAIGYIWMTRKVIIAFFLQCTIK